MGNPNPRNVSRTNEDLHNAARAGDLHAVQTICTSNPLAVNFRDKHSRTPLHLAAWAGKTEVVRYLCQHKADAGAAAMDDMGAIHFASQKGHLEVVRILLSSGVSVKAANRKGFTPLHYAVQGSHLALIRYLIRKGANLSLKNKSGKSPLDLATDDDVRTLLIECEESSKKQGNQEEVAKAGDSSRISPERHGGTDSNVEDVLKHGEEDENNETRKRRDEDEGNEVQIPDPKKSKVSLNHLLAGNDIEEEEL